MFIRMDDSIDLGNKYRYIQDFPQTILYHKTEKYDGIGINAVPPTVLSYDFNDIQPFWDTRYMQGAYSQLGDITALITKQDNALAIIGAGEGIEIQFIDDLPQLEGGFNRYYLLKFKGWAKDMDILTKGGETLDPIPSDGPIDEHAKELNLKYNNRFRAGK